MWAGSLTPVCDLLMYGEPHIVSQGQSPQGHREGPEEVACTFPQLYKWLRGLSSGNMKPDWASIEALSKMFTNYEWLTCWAPANSVFGIDFEL